MPHLDFSSIWPVLVVGANATLTVRDVALESIAPYNTPEVAQSGYPQAVGLTTFPSVILEDGAQVGGQAWAASAAAAHGSRCRVHAVSQPHAMVVCVPPCRCALFATRPSKRWTTAPPPSPSKGTRGPCLPVYCHRWAEHLDPPISTTALGRVGCSTEWPPLLPRPAVLWTSRRC